MKNVVSVGMYADAVNRLLKMYGLDVTSVLKIESNLNRVAIFYTVQ